MFRVRFPGRQLDLPHLLITWLGDDTDGQLAEIFAETGLTIHQAQAALNPLVGLKLNEDNVIMRQAINGSRGRPTSGLDIWLALCETPDHRLLQAMIRQGLHLERLRKNLEQLRQNTESSQAARLRKPDLKSEVSLRRFARDLLSAARKGEFDDLHPRPDDIDRMVEVILRRTKRNPALTGPAGVGKTALVELLARMVARDELPALSGTKVYELSIAKLVGGTRYRGDFEQRLDELLTLLERLQPILVFVDELHLLVGAGRAEGIITDASNLLKPYLARGRICLIGATTTEEYQRHVAQGDRAFARRFEEVRVQEPRGELCRAMVEAQARAVAKHHDLAIPGDVVAAAIELTDRHLTQRCQPDKASTLIDTAASRARRAGQRELDRHTLRQVLAQQTGRPVELLSGEARQALSHLASRLGAQVLGQDLAIERVASTLVYRLQDLADETRPLGSFLFAGDTGVGKTELARALAAELFSDPEALLQLDLAEYAEGSSVNKLIGAPPGYSGSEQIGGVLVDWLHEHQSGVILLDEAEKAASEIHRLLLGLLERGRIASARGEQLDARQCVLVLTTNAADSRELKRRAPGFEHNAAASPAEVLANYFPRELLGRLDELIVFEPLSDETLRQVLKLRLSEAEERLRSRRRVTLLYDEDQMLDWLGAGLDDQGSGARGIARLLERRLLQPLALALLLDDEQGDTIFTLDDRFYTDGAVTPARPDHAWQDRKLEGALT
jgi:ATP-dependent Clp protease ATP-binding subunit ClpA